jgi:TonB family protein
VYDEPISPRLPSTRRALLGALVAVGCASSPPAPASQPAARAAEYQREFIYVRGPGDLDCPAEIERARRQGDAGKIFFAELRCKVNAHWQCPAACRADELLVTHVGVRVDRQGQLLESQLVRPSERTDFDQMSVAAVKTAAPFAAPPPTVLSGDAAAFNVELACDCARRR